MLSWAPREAVRGAQRVSPRPSVRIESRPTAKHPGKMRSKKARQPAKPRPGNVLRSTALSRPTRPPFCLFSGKMPGRVRAIRETRGIRRRPGPFGVRESPGARHRPRPPRPGAAAPQDRVRQPGPDRDPFLGLHRTAALRSGRGCFSHRHWGRQNEHELRRGRLRRHPLAPCGLTRGGAWTRNRGRRSR